MIIQLRALWDAVFSIPSIEDVVMHETEVATAEAEQAEGSMRKSRFIKHMALHRLSALEAWNHGRILDKLPPSSS